MKIVQQTRTITLRTWTDFDRARSAGPHATAILPPNARDCDAALEVNLGSQAISSRLVVGGMRSPDDFIMFGEPWQGFLWMIVDSVIYRVPQDLADTAWLDLEYPVSEARVLTNSNVMVAVCDAQIVSVDHDLNLKWSIQTDIITDFRWDDTSVAIEQMDGPALRIAYVSGKDIST